MFRCQNCDTVVPAGTPAHKIVTQTREKEYAQREAAPDNRRRFGRRFRRSRIIDPGGHGHEIVREIMVCPECAEQLAQQEPTHHRIPRGTTTAEETAPESSFQEDSSPEASAEETQETATQKTSSQETTA